MKTLMRKKNRIQAFLLAIAVMVSTLAFGMVSMAATYEGKGTKTNPYIVKTAEQLVAMGEKPSAHYKLGNTIDMKGVAFKPIGYYAKPFTGSFTCDLGSDGAPLYAIKNLTYKNSAGEKYGHAFEKNNYSDYKKDNSHWEAALFGATKNATITNIYVLNANITNTVVGQVTQNSDGSWNPGQDEQPTAILVGRALNTKISGCYVTGTVTSRTNDTGGVVGRAEQGTAIRNTAANVNVTAEGWWNIGGFVGFSDGGASIDGCSFSGNLKKIGDRAYLVGGFFGDAKRTVTIQNCYATGTVSGGTSFAGVTDNMILQKVVKNNYTLMTVAGRDSAPTSTSALNNCWVTNAVGGSQLFFGAASNADLLQKFAGLEAWVTSGVSTPQLKAAPVVKAADAYQPVAVTDTPGDAETPEGTENPETPEGTEIQGDAGEVVDIEKNIDITAKPNKVESILFWTLAILIAVVALTTVIIQILNIVYLVKNRNKAAKKTGKEKRRNKKDESKNQES